MKKRVSILTKKGALPPYPHQRGIAPLGTLLLWLCVLFASRVYAAPVVPVAVGERASGFEYDIRSMIQMNPDFSTYSEAGAPDGVIWLKRVHYGPALNGGAERRTMWIILGREGLPRKWLSWNVPVPKGGEAEFLEASVYSPGSAEKISEAVPFDSLGGTARSVTFSGLPDEFILAVDYKEVFPEKLSVDGLEWTSESLPVWEAVVSVAPPAGHPFYYFSSPNVAPTEEQVSGRTEYEWRFLNIEAETGPSLKSMSRSYVTFGSWDGKSAFARFVREAERAPLPPAPQAVRSMFGSGGKDAAKTASNILNWIYEQPEVLLTAEPREVPPEAPWTVREKTLLAGKWLKEAGVDSRLFWSLAYAPENGKPVSGAAVIGPVLEVLPAGPKAAPFYCDMEHMPRGGDSFAPGAPVYGLRRGAGDELEERRPPARKAADNALSVRFDLTLSEEGIAAGTVRISAKKAWRQFLFPNAKNPADDALAAVMKSMFTQTPRYGALTFSETGAESVLTAELSGSQAIKDAGHIMVSPPPLVPGWFARLSSGPFPYDLNFPFVMDVRIVMALPKSTSNAILPSTLMTGNTSAGKVRYTDSFKLDRRKRFVAEAKVSVDTTRIADENAAALTNAIQNWQTFITRYLPVQLRNK